MGDTYYEPTMIWIIWQISVLCDIHILFPFHLLIIRRPILIAKSHYKMILDWRMLFKVDLSVCSIRVSAKKTWAIPIMNPLSWFMIICTKWQISVSCDIHILFPFHLLITRGPMLIDGQFIVVKWAQVICLICVPKTRGRSFISECPCYKYYVTLPRLIALLPIRV